MSRRELKRAAKDSLRGRRFGPFVICVLYLVLCLPAFLFEMVGGMLNDYVAQVVEQGIVVEELAHLEVETLASYASACGLIGLALTLLISCHARVGLNRYFIRFTEGKSGLFVFIGGCLRKYFRVIWVNILSAIKVVLWFFVFIIPGIIKSVEYSMIPYVLADCPELSTREVFRETRALMKGCKWKLFWLEFSFIGWYILCTLTLGIGLIFFLPYHEATIAKFYHYAREKQAA